MAAEMLSADTYLAHNEIHNRHSGNTLILSMYKLQQLEFANALKKLKQ
jgi:hypothetical protein